MKKYIFGAMMLAVGFSLVSCEDDNDDNPTLTKPTSFTLYTPSFSNQLVNLASSEKLNFYCSYPNYGFPIQVKYSLEYSLNGNFTVSAEEAEADESGTLVADYASSEITSSANVAVSAADLATALQRIALWDETNVPEDAVIYVRAKAEPNATTSSTVASYVLYSNVLQLHVTPYYVELSDAPIDIWYLIGGDIADGSWGGTIGTNIYPLMPVKDFTYDKKTGQGEISYTGYFAGNGFKLKHTPDSWDEQWGQGGSFGEFVKNDGGSANITVPSAGYYKVTLNTATDKLTVEEVDAPASTYAEMGISGSFNDWGFETMKACDTYDGAKNHLWYYEIESDGNVNLKTLTDSSWSTNWGAADFPYGIGEQNGSNIVVAEGSWIFFFNDIDGSYFFVAK